MSVDYVGNEPAQLAAPTTIEGPYWPLVPITIKPTVKQIRDRTAEYFGITREEIVGPRRTRNLVRPRQTAMFLARRCTNKSYPEIGRMFGGRDHTTVMHAEKRIARLVGGECGETAASVAELEREFAPRQQFSQHVAPIWPDVVGVAI